MPILTKLLAFGIVHWTARALGDGDRRSMCGLPEGDSASSMRRVGLEGVTSIFISDMSLVAAATGGCG